MLRNRIILLMTTIILVVIIFTLPRGVVDNKSGQSEMGAGDNAIIDPNPDVHLSTIKAEDRSAIDNLKKKISAAENSENITIFADSLAELYKRYSKPDSAAYYAEMAGKNAEEIGNQYYEAFTFAVEPEKAKRLGALSRQYLTAVLEDNPERLDLKTKIAMTFISTENPMQGISMLREVLDQDPNHIDAIFNLGVLAIQSKQYDKAVPRFARIIELQPENETAEFYLAFCYYNMGQDAKAKVLFEKLVETSQDEDIKATSSGYLKELN